MARSKKPATAEKPRHWVPRLSVIRGRNKQFLAHSREACKLGEFIHISGLVFLEVEALIRYIDALHDQMRAAGMEPRKSDFADLTATQDLEPETRPEPGDDDDDPDDEVTTVTRGE